jgi:pilus assembly protein CpaD
MTHRFLLLAAAGLSLSLGGCGGTQNRGLESVHQPVVDRQSYALDLQTAAGSLASGEGERLVGWFDAMKLGYGDRVAIDDPDGAARPARAQVGGIAAGYGLLVSGDLPASMAPVSPGTLRVVVTRMRASVPGCPDWTRDATYEYDSNTSSSYGCATNGNLAAMIASPADLVRGQESAAAGADLLVGNKAIETFRKREPTGAGGLKTESVGAK